MNTLFSSALRLAAFSAAAALTEMLLPEGKARRLVGSVLGLLALRLMAEALQDILGTVISAGAAF